MAINDPSDSLPLADVWRAANGLISAGLIEDWALGGALAAIYYVEPFTTYDADIFFIPKDKHLTAGIPAIYSGAPGFRLYRAAGLVAADPSALGEAMREMERPETLARLRGEVASLRRLLAPERLAARYLVGLD